MPEKCVLVGCMCFLPFNYIKGFLAILLQYSIVLSFHYEPKLTDISYGKTVKSVSIKILVENVLHSLSIFLLFFLVLQLTWIYYNYPKCFHKAFIQHNDILYFSISNAY